MMMNGYTLETADGEFSADPADYWYMADGWRFDGAALVKRSHLYRTVSGRPVWATRLLKTDPTMADLRRLAAARKETNR